MAEKTLKTKQQEKVKEVASPKTASVVRKEQKPKVETPRAAEKKQSARPGRLATWWRETIGELRKVTWPTLPEARRLTVIVLIVVGVTSLALGLLDWVFSRLIALLISL
ncbi:MULTISPECIES: preprotein translocase subunit SecE [Anaerolinea]|uniref:Protein translocase subunit SecE n=1 Tax=Anaerolinea thermophila (strain DSM 14523 / JCM 11388 / NBRC 100420 / UNI-1) TaxID=926569 RepID=E8N662_ANATU|nr:MULTISPECIES: preprotein translocase subunit SecE [Anaerolinea]BAJ63926.1 preprotein translocase SecE subunit [Anaerolinea thermophila UNI-1]